MAMAATGVTATAALGLGTLQGGLNQRAAKRAAVEAEGTWVRLAPPPLRDGPGLAAVGTW